MLNERVVCICPSDSLAMRDCVTTPAKKSTHFGRFFHSFNCSPIQIICFYRGICTWPDCVSGRGGGRAHAPTTNWWISQCGIFRLTNFATKLCPVKWRVRARSPPPLHTHERSPSACRTTFPETWLRFDLCPMSHRCWASACTLHNRCAIFHFGQ